jgi:hypothetical protein
MGICVLDFALFPIFWSILQTYQGVSISQWVPMTLQGGGLFHIAYGAILGVTAWSRGREKMTAMEYNCQESYGINSGGYGYGYDNYSRNRDYSNRNYDIRNEVEGSNENR